MAIKSVFFVFIGVLFSVMQVEANTNLRFDYSTDEMKSVCDAEIEKADKRFGEIQREKGSLTFSNTIRAFDEAMGNFVQNVSPLSFLNLVSTDPKVRDQSRECETKTDQYLVDLYTRKPLYEVVLRYSRSKEYETLGELDRRLVDKVLLAFKRAGMSLSEDKRKKVITLQKELIDLQNQFSKAIADYSDFLEVSKDELKGLSDTYISGLEKTVDGKYKVNLSYPQYMPFMENAEHADSRRKLLEKYSKRAGQENVKRLEKALEIRSKVAELLGYESHAAYVLEDRMAKTPGAVFDFLKQLKARLEPLRIKEFQLMSEFKSKDSPKDNSIYDWDFRYYTNKIKKKKYDVDAEMLRDYFPLDHVTKSMFDIYQNMLGVVYTEVSKTNAWHSDVKLFEVRNKGGSEVIAYFYMDLFPRDGKYTHAAAATIRYGRQKIDGERVVPVSSIVANFAPASEGRASLLSHSEVETYFHEFGHIMHQVLTESKYDWFSGTKVARDFVEAPSQMLENWTWDEAMLGKISSHHKTKKPLPAKVIQKMIAAKNLNIGLFNCRQVLLGLFDITMHTSKVPVDTTSLWKKLQEEIMGIPLTPGAIPQAAIGHYMGGYDAAYYGYLWSEVFAADMFDKFKKNGLSNASIGSEYRKWILAPGGSKDASDLLKGFLGREPATDAFFEQLGLQK